MFKVIYLPRWSTHILFRIEYLGFRYHGWQKQPGVKTVQGMIDKTLKFVLGEQRFRTLGSGRTDAKVSADDFVVGLFLMHKPENLDSFLEEFNKNLPSDIRAKNIHYVDAKFNVIQDAKLKEYHYYFSFGEKAHPFSAPFVCNMGESLNIEAMQQACEAFVGVHNFKRYVCKPSDVTVFEREIVKCVIEKNTRYKADFIPENTYVLKVASKGFLRYQVRLMMGALEDVGNGFWSVEDLKKSLIDSNGTQIENIAPASALLLHRVDYL